MLLRAIALQNKKSSQQPSIVGHCSCSQQWAKLNAPEQELRVSPLPVLVGGESFTRRRTSRLRFPAQKGHASYVPPYLFMTSSVWKRATVRPRTGLHKQVVRGQRSHRRSTDMIIGTCVGGSRCNRRNQCGGHWRRRKRRFKQAKPETPRGQTKSMDRKVDLQVTENCKPQASSLPASQTKSLQCQSRLRRTLMPWEYCQGQGR
jgi:hypothetical protein